MITIDLFDGFFIEVDDLNYTLKQRYEGKDKKGNVKDAERIIGYYTNVKDAVERFARLDTVGENNGRVISLLEYAKEAEKTFERFREIVPLNVRKG